MSRRIWSLLLSFGWLLAGALSLWFDGRVLVAFRSLVADGSFMLLVNLVARDDLRRPGSSRVILALALRERDFRPATSSKSSSSASSSSSPSDVDGFPSSESTSIRASPPSSAYDTFLELRGGFFRAESASSSS
jgi:hypothetical protein